MKHQLITLLFFALLYFPLSAQLSTLSGRVTDQENQPIVGVSIAEKGAGRGTISDAQGNFSMEVSPNAILLFTYVGFRNEEIRWNGQSPLVVVLKENSELLDEVVVVGYGTVAKKDITGAISTIGGGELANIKGSQLSQELQGMMPGVMVTRTNSMPGAAADIKIRGITTLSDNNPLIIVDGVPYTNINDVNVNDIKDITVLKDAASASIYGARAAAGVILITTKNAQEGVTSIEIDASYGVEKATELPRAVGVKRYLQMQNEFYWNDAGNPAGGEYPLYTQEQIDNWEEWNKTDPNNYPVTDWLKLLLNENAPRERYSLNIAHGGKVVNTRASLSYENTHALYDHRNYSRILTRINNRIKISDMLEANADLAFNHSNSNNPTTNPIQHTQRYAPIYAALWADGRIAGGKDKSNMYADLHYGGFDNSANSKVNGRISLEFNPFKGFSVSGTLSPFYHFSKGKQFIRKVPYYSAADATILEGYIEGHDKTNLTETRGENYSLTKQLLLNYKNTFAAHSLNLMAGYEDYYYFTESLSASTENMELNNYPYLSLGNKNFLANAGGANESAYRSYFGRLIYNFDKKYYLQTNLRYDGSSRFHPDYRWASFPSVSLGWAVSEENFLKNVKEISLLKFRASLGSLGNERIGYYPYQSTISYSSALFYQGDNVTSSTTAGQVNYAIEDISWETTDSWNVGIDGWFLGDRLGFTGDLFVKNTRDMLLELEVPDYLGYENPNQNTGTMSTKGWEFAISWKDKIGDDFGYSLSFNLSDFVSKMGNLGGTVFLDNKIIRENSEYNEWYGYQSEGLFQTADDVENSAVPHSSVKPGDIKYKDISGPDGVPDGLITPEYDKVLLGSSLPHFMYGGNISVNFKGIDFSLVFQGVGKQTSRLEPAMIRPFQSWWTAPSTLYDGNYWSVYNTEAENLKAKYPRLSYSSSENNNYEMSDFWLFNGSYFRLKNITIGYTFPEKLLQPLHIKGGRIYASASDLFSVSNYPQGWDPEAAVNSYIAVSYNVGLNIKF